MSKHTRTTIDVGRNVVQRYPIALVLVAVCLLLASRSPQFSTVTNISNVLDQVSMIGIITMGMVILLVSANFDLSIGGMVGLSTVVTAKVSEASGLTAGVLAGLAVAVVLGAVNGLIVTKLKVNSLVATLGSGLAYAGCALLVSKGTPVVMTDPALTDFMNIKIAGISMPAYLFLATIVVSAWYLHITVAGQQTFAVGANADAARYAGVRVELIRFVPFVITGLFAGIASIILTGLLGSGVPTAATAWPLLVVAGAVVGGVSIAGGRGTIAMGVLGVMLIGVINNGLNLLDFDAAFQSIATGTILVGAVAVDAGLNVIWRRGAQTTKPDPATESESSVTTAGSTAGRVTA